MDIGDLKNAGKAALEWGRTKGVSPIRWVGQGVEAGGQKLVDGALGGHLGGVGQVLVDGGSYMDDHALRSLGAGSAVYLANKFLGNPVGGVTDAVTFGLTNFRPDENRGETFGDQGSVPYSVPYQQGTPYDTPQGRATTLDEKQIAYEMKRLAKINAVNNITMAGLSDVQRQQAQVYR